VLASKNVGDPDFAVSATASSSLTITFAASGSCTVASSTVHLTGAGSCTITASQAGDGNYNPALAIPQSFTVNKALPLVTLSCPSASFDTTMHACTATVTGIGNVLVSGATALTYNGNSAAPANAGTYSVGASFASGDGNYANATGIGSLAIAKDTPTVTVICPPVVFDGGPHVCTAAATGIANAVVSGSSVLTYNGSAAPSAGGTYAVSATFISGDSNYADNTGIGSLIIAKAGQTITFAALAAKTLGDPDFVVSATASSSLTVTFAASGNCTVAGSTVHLTGVGSCTVTASQPGNGNYNAATSISRSFAINQSDDFTISSVQSSVFVTAGQLVVDHITITPHPATLTVLALTCSGLPAKASCTFAPNTVRPGSAPTDVIMTITTTAASTMSALQRAPMFYTNWLGFTSLGLIGVVVVGVRTKSRKRGLVLLAFSLGILLTAIGCATARQIQGTPSGTVTVTVTGSTASFTHVTTLTLTVN
jgi:MBG domain-containing protein